MNAHAFAIAALTLFAVTSTAAPARAEKPAPIRIAFSLESRTENAEGEASLLDAAKNLIKVTERGRFVVIDSAAPADAVVNISYPFPWGRTAPIIQMVAKVDDRELDVTVLAESNRRKQQEYWRYAGAQLARDIVVVLTHRGESADEPPSVDVLIERLSRRYRQYPARRAEAADRLGKMGPQGRAAIPALLELLGDESPVRVVGSGNQTTPARVATYALIALEAHPELIAFAQSKADNHLRANALTAIAIGRSAESPNVILHALDDRSRDVRTEAASLSAAYVGRRAAPKLIALLSDDHARTRDAARRSLLQLAGQDVGQDAEAWRSWWNAQDRRE